MFNLSKTKTLITNCDMAENWQTMIQDIASPYIGGMFIFNSELMYYIIIIGLSVCFMLIFILIKFLIDNTKKQEFFLNFTHGSLLESVWTVLPAIILFLLSIPSFSLLYSLDELVDPLLTIKIIGHQWYWSYEYSDYLKRVEVSVLNAFNFSLS